MPGQSFGVLIYLYSAVLLLSLGNDGSVSPWRGSKAGLCLLPTAFPFVFCIDFLRMTLLHHPDANRTLHTPDGALHYRLERSRRRRSVGLLVSEQGLVVRAPSAAALPAVESVLHTRWQWVLRKLRYWQQAGALAPALNSAHWTDGGMVQLRGEAYRLVCRAQLPARDEGIRDGVLYLRADADSDTACRQRTEHWLRRQARQLLHERLAHFAPLVGVQHARMRLSSARTRWGSAGSTGTISLNWRLVQLPPALLDYVAVHELCHLHEMNHSPRFWAHVQRVLPDYQASRTALRAFGGCLRSGTAGGV